MDEINENKEIKDFEIDRTNNIPSKDEIYLLSFFKNFVIKK